MSFDAHAQDLDSILNLPRPAQGQFQTPYRVTIDLLVVVLQVILYVICCFVSSICALLIPYWLGVGMQGYVIAGFVILTACTLAGLESTELLLPYYRINQRETFGAARWATLADLKQALLVRPKTILSFARRDGYFWPLVYRLTWRFKVAKKEIEKACQIASVAIGHYGLYHELAMTIEMFARHIIVIGPPGAGKSVLFMSVAREWARVGAAMIYSTKYNLFARSALYYEDNWIIDFIDPTKSDRLNLITGAKNNAEYAHQLAALMVGFNPNANNQRDPFWPMAATAFLKTMLLHLAQLHERPHPGMILEYLGSRNIEKDNQGNIIFDSLDEDLLSSPDKEIRISWGNFRQVDPRTQTNVFVTMTTMLEPFRSPFAMAVFTPPSEEEVKRGIREIDMRVLRQKGRAIYVIVPHGQAARMKVVLSTVFGVGAIYLRSTGEGDHVTPCLMQIDEAANVPLHTLPEDVNVNRELGVCFMLGYQSFPQPAMQMGHDAADAIWEGVGTIIFLPGIKGKSAKFAVECLQKTTAMQRSSRDAQDDRIDSENTSETGRDLMDAYAFRTMKPYTQFVALIGTSPPVRGRFLPNAADVDPRRCVRKSVEIVAPPSLTGKPHALPTMEESQALVVDDEVASAPSTRTFILRRDRTQTVGIDL